MERFFEGIGEKGKESVRRIHSGVENRCSVGRVTPSSSEGMSGEGIADRWPREGVERTWRQDTYTDTKSRLDKPKLGIPLRRCLFSISMVVLATFYRHLLRRVDRKLVQQRQKQHCSITRYYCVWCTRALILTSGWKVRARVRTVTRMQA